MIQNIALLKLCSWKSTSVCLASLLLLGCTSSKGDVAEDLKPQITANSVTESHPINAGVSYRNKLLTTTTSEYVMVVAHRGCWQKAPENSISAINDCLGIDVDMVEIDVRKTKDNKLVVIHDESVDRTTNGTGLVTELTLEDIQSLFLKDRSGNEHALTDEHPPSLREALSAIKGNVLVNLDLKESLFDEAFSIAEDLDMADHILMKMNAGANSETLTQASFVGKVNFMPIMFECDPYYEVYCENTLSTAVDDYRSYNPVAFEVLFQTDDYITEAVTAIKAENARLWVNTLFEKHAAGRIDADALDDPDAIWGEVVGLGFNIIQTDNPAELIDYLNKKGLRKVPFEHAP